MRILIGVLALCALAGSAVAGLWLAQSGWPLPGWLPEPARTFLHGEASSTSPIVYYRDPDGKPSYSDGPTTTEDGRAYMPVRIADDVSFDPPAATAAAADETPADTAGRKVKYYRNPMGLPDTSPVPKKDSMGMDYIAVYEGEDEDGSTIRISPGKLQRTGVRSEPAERRVLSIPITAPGTIQLDERRVSVVTMRAQSFVEKVEPVTTGDPVKKGQPLLRLYSPEITAAAAQYLSVLNERSSSGGAILEGARRRLENFEVPADFYAEIERTRKVPLTVTWRAPRDGIVIERNVVDGMRAMPGDVLFRLADVSLVWALVDIAERDLPRVAVGQTVTVRPRGNSNRAFTGKISLIYPQINRETRTGRIRIELANPDLALLPDMYVEAEIATGADKPVIAVPRSAVIDSGERQIVIIDKGEGRFEPREVKFGQRGEDYIEIAEGVSEGDQVVVSANFLIDAESNLKAAIRGLSESEAAVNEAEQPKAAAGAAQ